jgi:hypothetical protein
LLVTAPVVAKLALRPRLWAYRQLKAGRFGAVTRRKGRALEAELAGVEAVLGPFPPERLRAAGLRVSEAS